MSVLSSKYYRKPWYERGKVLFLGRKSIIDGSTYRHPIRPYHPGDYFDEQLVRSFLSRGEVVIIVDFGFDYFIPGVYNDIPISGSQLSLDI